MDFKIAFTDREITAWGGMVFMNKLIEKSGILEKINDQKMPSQGSNRGYSPKQLIISFWISVWCGANRFMHLEVLRMDATLQKLFGWKRMAGYKSFQRYFSKFTTAVNHQVFHPLYQWFFERLVFDNYTLDFDSTVITRYGNQQGAKKGYNVRKPGRKSHHPLMAFVSDCRMVANFWLRSGDSHTANNFEGFLLDTLDKLRGKTIGLLRADSGFYCKNVFDILESHNIQYIIAARMYAPLQRRIVSLNNWLELDSSIAIATALYQSPQWDRPRRIVVVKQAVEQRPQATGKQLSLFEEDNIINGYRYSAFVTNLTLPAIEVWHLYKNRADAENRIKELKEDFGLESFCMDSFDATEAALNWVMIAYNLMSLFRQAVLKTKVQPHLKTLRYKIFAVPAYITKDGNQRILNMSVAMQRRKWFDGLFTRSHDFVLPYRFST